MTKVLTHANMAQFLETGIVDDYKSTPTPKVESNAADGKTEVKVAPVIKATEPESKPETTTEVKTEGSTEAKDKGKSETKSEAKAEDKTDVKKPDASEKSDAKADELDEDGLTAKDRAVLGQKYDKVIAKRHRLQKEAEEARKEADDFAENQYRERMAAEKRAEELAAQLAALQKSEPKKVVEDVEPQEDDAKYKDNPKLYWQEWARWTSRQELKAEREKIEAAKEVERQADVQRQTEARNGAFAKRMEAAAEEIDDFRETLAQADAFTPGYILEAIIDSDLGPQIAYHFVKHPEVLEALKKLSPIKAISEVGKLETKLEKKAEKAEAVTEKVVSEEDKPVLPIGDSRTKSSAKAAEPVEPEKEAPVSRSKAPEPIKPLANAVGTVHVDIAEQLSTVEGAKKYWAARAGFKRAERQRH